MCGGVSLGQTKISEGQMVNVGKDHEGKEGLYRLKVMAVYKNKIELDLPMENGERPEMIGRGELLTISFAARSGLNKLDVKVKQVNEMRKIFSVMPQGEIQRIQRRRYVRISLKKEIKYQRIVNEEDDFIEAMMIDISASGLKMRINELNGVAMYQVLDLKLHNLSFDINCLKGRVVRLKEKKDPATGKSFYDLAVEFIDITSAEREKLIEWVLSKQRELRQNGLL